MRRKKKRLPKGLVFMAKITRIICLILAAILLAGAAMLAAHNSIPGAIGLLVLATLAATFERLLAIEQDQPR
jgi:hypothetical protein